MKKVIKVAALLLVLGGLTVHYDSGKDWYRTLDIRWRVVTIEDRWNIIRQGFDDKSQY